MERPPYLKLKGLTTFFVRYTPENIPTIIAQRYLMGPIYNPLRVKTEYLYSTRERGILWWTIQSGNTAQYKAVVRSYCRKKLRNAFFKALEENGLDRAGRRLIFDSEGKLLRREKALKGTVELAGTTRLLDVRRRDVLYQTRLLVRHLMEKQGIKAPK